MMNSRNLDIVLYTLAGVIILTCFSLVYLENFLLFHTLSELLSIVIGFSIFIITWNSRFFIVNKYIIYLGIAFLFTGILDVLHLLSYHGMPFFQEHGTNLPTQLWILSRYILALAIFSAPIMMNYRISIPTIFTAYLLITITIIVLIFNNFFPDCYIDGEGLSVFKKVSEYVISFIFAASIILLLIYHSRFDRNVLILIITFIIFSIFSELCFTMYVGVYDFFNFTGHFIKILSFLFLYRAIIVTGLKNPYSLLFRELNQQREEYHSLFTNMIDGFARHHIITDEKENPVDYVYNEINHAFTELTGIKSENIVGKRVTEIIPGIKDDPARWIERYGKVARTGESIRFESYSPALQKWFSVAAYSTKKGSFITVFQDTTERKLTEATLEKKVKERTDELEKRNQELQDFAFIASHDLQEPLRKIRIFGDMISDKIKTCEYDQVTDYISRMRSSAERMQNLIKSLLDYSRVTTASRPFEKTDLSKPLGEAMSNLEVLIKEKEAVIEISDLPSVEADSEQIVRLFQNLIENALKFHPANEPPRIKIYCNKRDNNICRITVEDKGIGFNTEYLSKIFIPFQRLHGKNEYPGTGIGLAICKKIVERHGGQMTAISEPGKGSSFIFTLPVTH